VIVRARETFSEIKVRGFLGRMGKLEAKTFLSEYASIKVPKAWRAPAFAVGSDVCVSYGYLQREQAIYWLLCDFPYTPTPS
jgi:hypothetical protein